MEQADTITNLALCNHIRLCIYYCRFVYTDLTMDNRQQNNSFHKFVMVAKLIKTIYKTPKKIGCLIIKQNH